MRKPDAVCGRLRMMAMAVQREHHFLGEHADIEKGVRTTATVISTGPAYAIVEALGVETTIGAAHLSAYEYIEDVSKGACATATALRSW